MEVRINFLNTEYPQHNMCYFKQPQSLPQDTRVHCAKTVEVRKKNHLATNKRIIKPTKYDQATSIIYFGQPNQMSMEMCLKHTYVTAAYFRRQ